MSDIFISYARSSERIAQRVAETLRKGGYAVWRDDQLPAHRPYADVIEERLRGAKAVLVLWSNEATQSQWVRAEADVARAAGTLVQLSLDGCGLPLPFNQIQCVDLRDWDGDTGTRGWQTVEASVAALMSGAPVRLTQPNRPSRLLFGPSPVARETLLAVLALDNSSNDPDLGYFSDGISEEILYTVARAKDLRVVGKASSFQFRGANKSPQKIAASLRATHILDGSVRRSGNNVRINVELVDTGSLETLWSERYDRALTDIFALQDEIAGAIAAALNHHFAPARKAVPVDPTAYDKYLRAHAIYAQDITWADQAKCIALLQGAVSLAPDFAQAWGRLALYRKGDPAVVAAQHGLALDPQCATSLAALAMTIPPFAAHAEKFRLADRAYRLAEDDQIIAGVYNVVLIALGLLTRACALSRDRFERDPLSPVVAGGLALVLRSMGSRTEAIAVADDAIDAFPEARYSRFVRAVIAIYDGDIDRATTLADTGPKSEETAPLQVLLIFMRAVPTMPPEVRAEAVNSFLHRHAPRTFLVDVGLAAAMGEPDMAMTHLLEAIRAGRPLEFSAENDGRGATDATVTTGLFMPNGEILRRNVRFAEVCVRLSLYDCWRELDIWPDCLDEVAPFYDLRAECAVLADTVGRYRAGIET